MHKWMHVDVAQYKFLYTNRQLLDLAPGTPEGSLACMSGCWQELPIGGLSSSACGSLHALSSIWVICVSSQHGGWGPRTGVLREREGDGGVGGEGQVRGEKRGRRASTTWKPCLRHPEARFLPHYFSWGTHQVQPSFKEEGNNRPSSRWGWQVLRRACGTGNTVLAIFRKYDLPLSHSTRQ